MSNESAIAKAARLPVGYYLKVNREINEETGEEFPVAVIMQEPPADGWPDGCSYFNHVPGVHLAGAACGWAQPVPQWAGDDVARVGVSATTGEDLERLTADMLDRFLASKETR